MLCKVTVIFENQLASFWFRNIQNVWYLDQQLTFPLDQGNSGVMQQRCMTCRCICLLASFNLNCRLLSGIIFRIRENVDVECVCATTGYCKCKMIKVKIYLTSARGVDSLDLQSVIHIRCRVSWGGCFTCDTFSKFALNSFVHCHEKIFLFLISLLFRYALDPLNQLTR